MLIVVLFNLKSGASRDDYENWAKSTDIPTVNALGSVNSFSVVRTTGMLGNDNAAPYQYVELLDIKSMDALGADTSSETMKSVAAQFQTFADNPQFILTESI
ncbi:MAG: REDY-like protein HapK [Congregibacter sp.]